MRVPLQVRLVFIFSLILAATNILSAAAPNVLTEEEKAGGWKLLFDGKTTEGWHSFKKQTFPKRGWEIEDGWLHCLGTGGGDIVSDGEFEQFELEWDWKISARGNSGVKYFLLETRNSAIGHEYQMVDEGGEPDARTNGKHVTAAFYDVLKPAPGTWPKPPGQINHSRVVVRGNAVEHWLNGAKVLEYSCSSEEVKAAVAQSKFRNVAGFGNRVSGHILLQDHGGQVWFQNVKIRPL